MALNVLNLKACLVSARTPFDQKQIILNPNQVKFGSTITRPENKWSILQDHTLTSSCSLNHLGHYNATTNVNFQIDHVPNLEVLKHMLFKEEEPFQDLAMVDAIQRLGIEHHFQEEIEAILERKNSLISNVPS